MAKFRVLKQSFVGNTLVDAGTIVDYDGETSDNLEALDPPADPPADPADGGAKKPRKSNDPSTADALA